MFVLQNAPVPDLSLPDLSITTFPSAHNFSDFDLTFYVTESVDGIVVTAQYDIDLFEQSTIKSLLDQFHNALTTFVVQPDLRIDAFALQRHGEEQLKTDTIAKPRNARFKDFIAKNKAPSFAASGNFVDFRPMYENDMLLLLATPKRPNIDPIEWVRSNREDVLRKLTKHGAILFRGFDIPNTDQFNNFVSAVTPDLLDYFEASTPRKQISGNIYTSTEYHASETIILHSEMSYAHDWPMRIWFYCDLPSPKGGETPIADNRKILELLPPEIRSRFVTKAVMYTRTCSRTIGLSWENIFRTDDPEKVQSYCRQAGIGMKWLDNNETLKTQQVRPAVATHPVTGDTVWFNQAPAYHYSSINRSILDQLLKVVAEEDLPRNAFFGDGLSFTESELSAVLDAYEKAQVIFPWNKGDVLLLDNMLVSHGRNPYEGNRRIAVAMADLYSTISPELSLTVDGKTT
jgi:alpha-ketoglutarate-dependent taurine dioxygenase